MLWGEALGEVQRGHGLAGESGDAGKRLAWPGSQGGDVVDAGPEGMTHGAIEGEQWPCPSVRERTLKAGGGASDGGRDAGQANGEQSVGRMVRGQPRQLWQGGDGHSGDS